MENVLIHLLIVNFLHDVHGTLSGKFLNKTVNIYFFWNYWNLLIKKKDFLLLLNTLNHLENLVGLVHLIL